MQALQVNDEYNLWSELEFSWSRFTKSPSILRDQTPNCSAIYWMLQLCLKSTHQCW